VLRRARATCVTGRLDKEIDGAAARRDSVTIAWCHLGGGHGMDSWGRHLRNAGLGVVLRRSSFVVAVAECGAGAEQRRHPYAPPPAQNIATFTEPHHQAAHHPPVPPTRRPRIASHRIAFASWCHRVRAPRVLRLPLSRCTG
jgi:hypothetical protein